MYTVRSQTIKPFADHSSLGSLSLKIPAKFIECSEVYSKVLSKTERQKKLFSVSFTKISNYAYLRKIVTLKVAQPKTERKHSLYRIISTQWMHAPSRPKHSYILGLGFKMYAEPLVIWLESSFTSSYM